jgi:predicted nuclease of predicted toxin-antitoxin system
MKILFDQGTPVPLRHLLVDHDVRTAYEMGWANLDNGQLLKAAETDFDALITTDQNLRYQQSVQGRRPAILVLPTTSWPKIQQNAAAVIAALNGLKEGDFAQLRFD